MPRCPIAFCSGTHPVKSDKSGSPFMFCDLAKSNVWFRSPDALAWLNRNGGTIPNRENPAYSPDNPREVVETVGADQADEDDREWPRSLPARSNPAFADDAMDPFITTPQPGELPELTAKRTRQLAYWSTQFEALDREREGFRAMKRERSKEEQEDEQ